MNKLIVILSFIAMACQMLVASIASAPAQDAGDSKVLTCLSAEEAQSLLNKAGMKPDRFTDGDGDPAYKVSISDDFDAIFFFYNPVTKGHTYETVQLVSAFKDVTDPERKCAAWNSKHRFSLAYVDGDSVVIEADLDCVGVTQQSVNRFLNRYRVTVAAFTEAMADNAAPEDDAGNPAHSHHV